MKLNKALVPCIILLDSLRAHQKNVIACNVRQWLNHEWKKVKKSNIDVFTEQSINVFSPKGNILFVVFQKP